VLKNAQQVCGADQGAGLLGELKHASRSKKLKNLLCAQQKIPWMSAEFRFIKMGMVSC